MGIFSKPKVGPRAERFGNTCIEHVSTLRRQNSVYGVKLSVHVQYQPLGFTGFKQSCHCARREVKWDSGGIAPLLHYVGRFMIHLRTRLYTSSSVVSFFDLWPNAKDKFRTTAMLLFLRSTDVLF